MCDYVTRAENVIKSLYKERGKIKLTTTQLRKFLDMTNAIDNKIKLYELKGEVKDNTLPEDIQKEILSMKVKLVYQSGREKSVKDFVIKSSMLQEIDNIDGKVSNFKDFFNYVEALVAYRKYEGDDT